MRLLFALALAGCCPGTAHHATPPPPAPVAAPAIAPAPVPPAAIRFIDDHNFATGTMFEGLRFGGISAISFDAERNRLVALSDAHREHAPARIYELTLTLDASELSAEIVGMLQLGDAFADGVLDPEGLAPGVLGRWLISTEGDGEIRPRLAPALYQVDRSGRVVAEHAMPDDWAPTPDGELTTGVFHNKGLEGLTATPSGRAFYAINEAPLAQDGGHASFERGARLRLVRFDRNIEITHTYLHVTEPVPRLAERDVEKAQNGVSALCAIADERILVMERATVKAGGKYHNRIPDLRSRRGGGRKRSCAPQEGSSSIWTTTSRASSQGFSSWTISKGSRSAPRCHPESAPSWSSATTTSRTSSGRRSLLLRSGARFNKR